MERHGWSRSGFRLHKMRRGRGRFLVVASLALAALVALGSLALAATNTISTVAGTLKVPFKLSATDRSVKGTITGALWVVRT
jgi:hypothetical protein